MKLLKFIIIFLYLSNSLQAKVIKPNQSIMPNQVVKIQLTGLMNNNSKSKDKGIEQTWEFAHPKNRYFTGPYDKFREMLKGESYNMLLNHLDHEIKEVFLNEEIAVYEVIIMDNDKNYYKFKWQVEKYVKNGPLKDCWLTTVVSQPIPLTDTA
tara:strand:+ start:228 stop:686 length:459 start_codon:yes stop_codon:yes gene_type:complete